MKWITLETRAGEPIKAGDKRLLPMAKVLRLKIPGLNGGLIWNRPASVVVQSADGQEQTLPVRDLTRQAQWLLLGAGILGALLIWILWPRR
ncbi:MAG: hypothetical protein JW726_12260 [Anaerolineales bacterium]|nr:hypothetical protein [Anaerolineales bacterium]